MEQINAGNGSLRRSKIKESRLESDAMNKQRPSSRGIYYEIAHKSYWQDDKIVFMNATKEKKLIDEE